MGTCRQVDIGDGTRRNKSKSRVKRSREDAAEGAAEDAAKKEGERVP